MEAIVRYKRRYARDRAVYFVEYEHNNNRYITGTVIRGTDRSQNWYFGENADGVREGNRIALLSDDDFSQLEDNPLYSWKIQRAKFSVVKYRERRIKIMTNETKASFTPGPWVISQNRILTGGYCDPDRIIATVCYRQSGHVQANIKLIAAAPELLAALGDVLRYCVTPKGMPDKDKGRTLEQQAALNSACAAIAKAKGE